MVNKEIGIVNMFIRLKDFTKYYFIYFLAKIVSKSYNAGSER